MFDSLDLAPHFTLESLLVLVVLVALEAVLSADNAIALASIAKGLDDREQQRQALNFGLLIAYVLRLLLIVSAAWVIRFWQFELAGALYLLWLVGSYFLSNRSDDDENTGRHFDNFWQAIPLIAFTDLAFSLDSVTTAIAVSDQIWLILMGGTIGVIALRFMAGLFIRWLKEYRHLEDAGYVTVGMVGLRLLVRTINEELVPPEWVIISFVLVVFAWGFSVRNPDFVEEVIESSIVTPSVPTPEEEASKSSQ
jgi:YkoY family integral membrane protein